MARALRGRVWTLVLLVEFQSTVDRQMAPRVLRYQAMAFEALLRQEEVDADGQLRFLSVVVYSGTARWTAPGAASGVTVSREGEILCSRPYLLLDTEQAAQDDFRTGNIVAAAFRVDNAATAGDAIALARSLVGGLSTSLDPGQARPLMEWLTIMLSRAEDDETRAAVAALRDELLNREAGMTRLAERMKEWDAELATAAELGRLIADISNTGDLESIGDTIIDCDSGTALLAAVGE